jgi:hypothetical protein
MSTPDGGDSPPRALLVAVAAMAAVALLVGLAIAAAVVSVASFAGFGEGGADSGRGGGEETLVIPRYEPTRTVDADSGAESPAADKKEKKKRSAKPSPRAERIRLFVAPQSVGPGERINFNGVYSDGEGVALQIQRKEGGVWTDFPVTATVRGGTFSTWIQTTRTGTSAFRVYDPSADRGSNPVEVTIG